MSKPGLLIPTARRSSLTFISLCAETLILAVGTVAETATAGHLIGVRNSKARAFNCTSARIWALTEAAPSTAQKYGVALKKVTGYTAAHTGGGTGGANVSAVVRNTDFAARDAASGEDGSGVIARVAGDAALTAGTHTIGGQIGRLLQHELVAAATVQLQNRERLFQSSDNHPLFVLQQDEGVLLSNIVLTANLLTYRAGIELFGYLG